jgi:hypothetical protein
MHFGIINKNHSKLTDLNEVKLLWTAILFSEKVLYATPLNTILTLSLFFGYFPERYKVNIIKDALKVWNKEVTPEDFESMYQQYLSVKKIKRKSREELLLLMRGEKMLNTYEKILVDNDNKILEKLGMKEFQHFVQIKEGGVIIPVTLVDYDHDPAVEKSLTFFEAISGTLTEPDEILLLDDSFDGLIKETELFRKKLFSFPAPETLTASQIRIIRKDFKEKFNNFNGFREYKIQLKDKSLDEMLKEADKGSGPGEAEDLDFQKYVDENIYIEQLRKLNPEGPEYELYMGVTSFENIISIYKFLGVLTNEHALYAREHLSKKVSLSNATPFLYLKVISN